MIRGLAPMVLAATLLAATAARAETGTLVRATELKAEPFTDAATIARLAEQSRVEILKRQGAWARIKAKEGEGWLRLLSLKLGAGSMPRAKADEGESKIGEAALSVLGIGPKPKPTVATGVRGLSEEDLKNAKPNPRELERMNQYAVSQRDARTFAESGRLRDQKIEYAPEP
jgi:hypothetical protein